MTQVQKNNISAAAQRMLFRSSLPISTPRPLHEAHDNKPNKGCLTWSLGALVGKATRATDEAQAKRTPKQDGPARLSSRRPTGAFFFVFSFFLLFHRGKETKGTIEEGRGVGGKTPAAIRTCTLLFGCSSSSYTEHETGPERCLVAIWVKITERERERKKR